MKHFSALMLLIFMAPLIAAASSQKPKDIFKAAEVGNIEAVRAFIESGAQVNAKDYFGDLTPLHEAAYYGHAAVAKLLIENDANVNAASRSHDTPLHRAASNGQTAVAQLLIENGAQVNAKDYFGTTPLHWAAYDGHTAVAQLLIQHGAQVNAANSDGDTPLYLAAINGHTAVAQLLGKIKALLDAIKKHDVATLNTTGIEWFCEQALAYALKEQEKGRSENTDAIVQMLSTAATKHLRSQREKVIAQVCRNHRTTSIWHFLGERQGTYPPAQRRRLDQPAPLTPSAAGPASAAATVSKL